MSGRFDLLRWPDDRRVGLLSLSSAAVLIVLLVTALAVVFGPSRPAAEGPLGGSYAVGSGVQPALAWPAPSASAASPAAEVPLVRNPPAVTPQPPASPLVATYRTTTLLGLGGFDTTVVVHNPNAAAHAWTVVLTMPSEHAVENRSADVVTMVHDGAVVTLRPLADLTAGERVTFTVRLRALLALNSAKVTCEIDGNPCRRA